MSSNCYVPPRSKGRGSSKPAQRNRGASGCNVGAINKGSSAQMVSSQEALDRRRQRFDSNGKPDTGYGLISRGEDNRLQRDADARRRYFDEIQREFAQLFGDLDYASLVDSVRGLSMEEIVVGECGSDASDKLSHVMISLRKLREALLNIKPDDFTKSVFLFSIRISSRLGLYQTYIPSITYLLRHDEILSRSELKEITYLYSLHLAHFNGDNLGALEVYFKYSPQDIRLRRILLAWRTNNYADWLEQYHGECDISRKKIMAFGESKMITHATNCIQKSYFQLPNRYLESLLHLTLDQLRDKHGCSWTLNGENVIIRVRK